MEKSEKIYNYLLENCIGYDNRVKADVLMKEFSINDHKTLRAYIENARIDSKYVYFIGSEAGKLGGYWIATTKQEKRLTLKNLIARAYKMLANAKLIGKKKLYEKA